MQRGPCPRASGRSSVFPCPTRWRWLAPSLVWLAVLSAPVRAQQAGAVPGATATPGTPTIGPDGKPLPAVGPDGKPLDPNAKPADAGVKVIRRTDYLKTPGSSDKIEIPLGADGKVDFRFEGTPWPPVLDWLARISGKSLDWQELPGDYLNLHIQRRYSPDEARDLLNWHLLSRGYTLLLHDEVFTVVNVKSLNPGIVPRVTIEELATRMPNEFVKLSLPLEWFVAEDAATQLAPMLSPNGKLSALKSVNRLEAIDVVSNLRDIVALLQDEQTSRKKDRAIVRVFKLEHVRADEVLTSLMGILGLKKEQVVGGGDGGNSYGMMQMMQQQMQQQMQMMQQQQQGAGGAHKPSDPRLVVNSRENSILATAPPDKMEIIEQTVKALDIPPNSNGNILRNLDRMRVYRLTTLKPGPLAEILNDVGDLSPGARIRIDKDNNSIVLFGTLADHVTVNALVQKLDGNGRNFSVVKLHRLQADEVAGSIQFMLGPEKKEETQRSRYSYYDYYGSNNQETTHKDERPFRVDADVENNRLLIWANALELKEVETLLAKLGEISSEEVNPESTRTLDFSSPEEAERMLKQMQELWPSIGPNKLLVPESTPAPSSETKKAPEAKPAAPRQDSVHHTPRTPARFSQLETVLVENEGQEPEQDSAAQSEPTPHPAEAPVPANNPAGVPPIAVMRMPDGRVIVGSEDTRALDRLEQLVRDIRPKTPDFKVFHLKNPNTWAWGLQTTLEDFFETKDDEKTLLDWYGDVVTTKDKTPSRLSKRRKLKFDSDSTSRTILVQNATATQLATIQELIDIYDQPESNDPRSVRVTRVFGLKHSEAPVIAETLKSVYRDLLSTNDPSLQAKPDDKQGPQQTPAAVSYVFGRNNSNSGSGDKKEPDEQPIRFKGLLSVGVDEISNSIVISSASGLMEDIAQLIESLDEAAKPPETKFQVMHLSGSLDATTVHEKLSGMLKANKKERIKVTTSGGNGNNGNNNLPGNGVNNNGNPNGNPNGNNGR